MWKKHKCFVPFFQRIETWVWIIIIFVNIIETIFFHSFYLIGTKERRLKANLKNIVLPRVGKNLDLGTTDFQLWFLQKFYYFRIIFWLFWFTWIKSQHSLQKCLRFIKILSHNPILKSEFPRSRLFLAFPKPGVHSITNQNLLTYELLSHSALV